MNHYGLIGYPLSHSYSKKYFQEKFITEKIAAHYELFELKTLDEFPALIKNNTLEGLNVTIPYKQSIIPFLDVLDQTAQETGAVNCIKIIHQENKNLLKGYNTDVYGFKQSIKPFLESKHERALILGTGGASKAVAFVLKQIGIDCLFVSRTSGKPNSIAYQDINEYVIKAHLLIVNTSPLGMFPHPEYFPDLPYSDLTSEHFLYDLIYNPEETVFLKKGKEKGALTMNGISMLHLQAEKSWEIFK
ncbi:MAG: shikimate dehydrogenase [Bacteroidetes bacterium]|nr:shikimate dehydrogenase [Bacteroidota bacterium]HET6244070.1 shikimate dehydrogenase [Bacteroidia bacterium]